MKLVEIKSSTGKSITGKSITDLNIKYGGGDFNVSKKGLTSLEGAPQELRGSFLCYENQLTSLEGAPQKVGGNFYCDSNQLISLEGAPREVGRNFFCQDNPIKSMKDVHKHIHQINGTFKTSASKDLEYILLIKGVTGVRTPNDEFDKVVNEYLKSNPSGSMEAVFDVKMMLDK